MPTIKIPGGKELIDARTLLEKVGVAEKMKVADLGCGRRGYFALQVAKMVGNKGLVYAVDIVKAALQSVESTAQLFGINNIKTVWADLEIPGTTKIPDELIDLVMLNNVLFQTKKPEPMIKEAVRILKKGGKVLVTDWRKIAIPFGPPIESRVAPEEVKKIAQTVGLTLEKEFAAGPYHYALVFKKK